MFGLRGRDAAYHEEIETTGFVVRTGRNTILADRIVRVRTYLEDGPGDAAH